MAACLRWKCYQAGTARVNWSELRWPLPIVQEHHCEHHSWLFFCFAGAPQREDNHLLSKSTTFSNKNRRMRGTDLELWQRVTNESSQDTTNAQICFLREAQGRYNWHHPRQWKQHEKNRWWVWEMLMHWKCVSFHSFSMDTSFNVRGHQLLAV